jgi:hypothetical protein
MRLPRDLTGAELIRHLAKLGYRQTRHSGSHDQLQVGTLSVILGDVAVAQDISTTQFDIVRQ